MSSPYLITPGQQFSVANSPTTPPADAPNKKELKKELQNTVDELDDLQRVLYADDRFSVLLVFQAMDAAGKDSTIRAVLSGVNPQGCEVHSFKKPSKEELEHDFLWRSAKNLPERGRIGVFNRSYYEETLVVRVHPEYLGGQRITIPDNLDDLWEERFRAIREHERHLAQNGTIILKFWLNVSKDEQKSRFLDRLQTPEKNWKFEAGDLKERGHWNEYMQAYEHMLTATSTDFAPWYAIPADDKPFMRAEVAKIVAAKLQSLGLAYPTVSPEEKSDFQSYEQQLLDE